MSRKIILFLLIAIFTVAIIAVSAFYLSNKSKAQKQEEISNYLNAEFEQTAGALSSDIFGQ